MVHVIKALRQETANGGNSALCAARSQSALEAASSQINGIAEDECASAIIWVADKRERGPHLAWCEVLCALQFLGLALVVTREIWGRTHLDEELEA